MPYTNIADVKTLSIESEYTDMESTCFVLTLDNTVNMQSDIVLTPGYQANETIITLPEHYSPTTPIYLPCWAIEDMGGIEWSEEPIYPTYLTIAPSGEISWYKTPSATTTLKTHGLEFNVMDKYYNEEIGNNDSSDWTIPLGEL